MWFNANPAGGANDMTNPLKGNYGYPTFMHELGHAWGSTIPTAMPASAIISETWPQTGTRWNSP